MWAGRFAKMQHAADLGGWTRFVAMENQYNNPPFTKQACQPAVNLRPVRGRSREELNKRLHRARDDVEALHQARKAGEQYRYAVELSLPEVGKKAPNHQVSRAAVG